MKERKQRGNGSFIDGRFNGIGEKAAMLPTSGRHARIGYAFPETGATKLQTAALNPTSTIGGPSTTTDFIINT
jgi:hypothetical protein